MTNIFIGNLAFDVAESQLLEMFGAYGVVESVTIVKDRDTSQSRGFAFVEMSKADEAEAAIRSLDGTILNRRTLRVNEARPKPSNNRRHDHSRGRDHRRHRY